MSWYRYPNGRRTPPEVTTPYMGYPGHNGCDSINHPGGYNYAIITGRVVFAGYNPSGAGLEVKIDAEDGNTTRQLHFARIDVVVGQWVTMGQILGVTGTTGDSTGIHCHSEILIDGSLAGRLDPWPYIAWRLGPDDKPAILKPNQRTTAGWQVAARTMADLTTTPYVTLLEPGTVVDCIWWQYGQGAGGNNVFYLCRFADGRQFYVHSGDIVESGVVGIPEYEGQKPKPPVVTPPVVVPPTEVPSQPEPPVDVPETPDESDVPDEPSTNPSGGNPSGGDVVKPVTPPWFLVAIAALVTGVLGVLTAIFGGGS